MEPITIIGILLVVLGVASFFIPQLTRVINFPGSKNMKAAATVVIGSLLILVGIL